VLRPRIEEAVMGFVAKHPNWASLIFGIVLAAATAALFIALMPPKF
jgi:hypothetical protein